MKNLYVTFTVEVADSEYSYQGIRGQAVVKIQVPRAILENIDPGNLFVGAMQAALANFDMPDDESED